MISFGLHRSLLKFLFCNAFSMKVQHSNRLERLCTPKVYLNLSERWDDCTIWGFLIGDPLSDLEALTIVRLQVSYRYVGWRAPKKHSSSVIFRNPWILVSMCLLQEVLVSVFADLSILPWKTQSNYPVFVLYLYNLCAMKSCTGYRWKYFPWVPRRFW